MNPLKIFSLFFIFSTLFSISNRGYASIELSVVGNTFQDSQKRIVILRGVNVSANAKREPFISFQDYTIFRRFSQAGINVVRLLFNWEAYEPAIGKYNEGYLSWLKEVAAAAWTEGIYTVIDFHQDAFSRYVLGGCGEGFPIWAVPEQDGIVRSIPDNGPKCENWMQLATLDIFKKGPLYKSYRAFYADKYQVRSRYLLLWKRIVEGFKSNPGVVGYDLINEPWGDETKELGPLYEDATAVIRAVDPTAIVFIEPHLAVGVGLKPNGLPKPTFGNFAYAPHFYDTMVVLSKKWEGRLDFVHSAFDRMQETADRWNVPVFIGEYGTSPVVDRGVEYLDVINEAMNDHMFSSAQWAWAPLYNQQTFDGWNNENYSIIKEDGEWQNIFRIRPSVQKLSGSQLVTKVKWNTKGDLVEFEARWNSREDLGKTEIFLPRPFLNKVDFRDLAFANCERGDHEGVLICQPKKPAPSELNFYP